MDHLISARRPDFLIIKKKKKKSGVLTGLDSELSFSKTSCLTKAEEPNLSYYLPIAGGRIIGFLPFPKGISAMWNAISPGFELVSPCPIPATITITPRAPPLDGKGDPQVILPSRLALYSTATASLQRGKTPPTSGLVGWGCRIHWPYLCRGVRLPHRVSWICHKKNLMNRIQ